MDTTFPGYAEQADTLLKQYESVRFADVHGSVLHLIPTVSSLVLDIGAGSGRDAAALAALGHRVVAVEPVAAFRTKASTMHPSPRIEWIDDALPHLSRLTGRSEAFDVALLTGVWMHLDLPDRRQAMTRITGLVQHGGLMILSFRHGPVPAGRRMFEVSAEETIDLATANGWDLALHFEHQADLWARPDVTWTRVAFSKGRHSTG